MTGNEFRIGNYLMAAEPEFANHPPFRIKHGDVENMISGNPKYKYKRVPLNPENLVKLGAKKINNSMFRMGALTFQSTTFTDGESLTERLLNTRKAMRVCFCGKFLVNLEFIDQYQNLYFALTGEELEIK